MFRADISTEKASLTSSQSPPQVCIPTWDGPYQYSMLPHSGSSH
jgi:hypothetical protein